MPRRNRRKGFGGVPLDVLESQLRRRGLQQRGERTKERPVAGGPSHKRGSWRSQGHGGGCSRVAGAPESPRPQGRELWALMGWLWGGDAPSSDAH